MRSYIHEMGIYLQYIGKCWDNMPYIYRSSHTPPPPPTSIKTRINKQTQINQINEARKWALIRDLITLFLYTLLKLINKNKLDVKLHAPLVY